MEREITIKVKKPTKQELQEIIVPLIPEPIKGDKGDTGSSYSLTEADKEEIAKKIDVPVVEKVIEKMTKIIRQPIVTNEIHEVIKSFPKKEVITFTESPTEIKKKLLEVGIDYDEISNTPDIEKMVRAYGQASKTVSLSELDDVAISGTQRDSQGKYVIGNSWDKPFGTATFTYDVDGNVETKTVGSTVLSFAYDVDGNVETITDGTHSKAFAYDVDGNVDTIVYS